MSIGKQFLSELKLHTDYLKWNDALGRYETWPEACDSILDMHRVQYGEKVGSLLDEIRPSLHNKEFLASQRNLQYRGEQVRKHNTKLYNCCTTYAYSPDMFGKAFYILLCGCGLGVSLKNKFVSQLPSINQRGKDVIIHVVEDSVEGWSEAVRALISSFCSHPSLLPEYYSKQIKFDFSLIRPKGAFIAGGFKAPGPDGLRQSLERIETLMASNTGSFKSIVAYDILMHISDAVLSGGVRRSALSVIMDADDQDMINAKTGNWRADNPQRARSNNSVGLIKGQFSKDDFGKLVSLNQGDSDVGFVFMNHEDEVFNPCFEIGFNFYQKIADRNESVFQFCNLNEINASACVDQDGQFSADKFYDLCRKASILGTLQAGFTSFPYLGKQTEQIVAGESLLGISITGWMMRPELFNAEILKKGAEVVKQTNVEVAKLIGINPAARTTTVKPSGNASVVLQTSSGIHPDHSRRYFRVMQLNKESETAKFLEINMPDILEESRWSATGSDYVVFVPCENPDYAITKDQINDIQHLEMIRLVQNSWVEHGKRIELCYQPETRHNVSNTVILDDVDIVTDYLFTNQKDFTAVSFVSRFSDLDYTQAPFTSIRTTEELVAKYGDGAIFMAGLIVDGLHYFENDLWSALDYVNQAYAGDGSLRLGSKPIETGTRDMKLLKHDWARRVIKFSTNFFQGDLKKTIYCMKDVHLWHKWKVIERSFKLVDFGSILNSPKYKDVDQFGAVACSGGACEIVSLAS